MPIRYENEPKLRAMLVHELSTKRDPTDPFTRELMGAWVDILERLSQETRDSKRHVDHQLQLARLYAEAGFSEDAIATYESAIEQAWRDYWDFAEEIERELALYQQLPKER